MIEFSISIGALSYPILFALGAALCWACEWWDEGK